MTTIDQRPASTTREAGVAHHGQEKYFIVGESDRGDGNGARAAAAVGDAAAAPPALRFSRLARRGRPVSIAARRKLADAMTPTREGKDGSIPAGFTYLGQFIDHDLTFDVTKVAFGENLTVAELKQARSPALDLDSLYGRGPKSAGSKKFYEADGLRLKMGTTAGVGGPGPEGRDHPGFDLPRVATEELAVIPDKRNDENLAVAQTHLAMIRFHNRVVARLASEGVPVAQRFARARALVVRHYQWMIRTDLLPRIVDPRIVNDVFRNGRKIFEVGAPPASMPTMPIEFSIGAFRLGHSMVRAAYDWNRVFFGDQGTLGFLFTFSGLGGFLNGTNPLPSNWIADFRRLYDFPAAGRPDLAAPAGAFNFAKRLDTVLVDPLGSLPPEVFGGDPSTPLIEHNLAFRNLTRAKMLSLATGQQLVRKLQDNGAAVTPLTRTQILQGSGGARLAELTADERNVVAARTPLWFYVLREAEVGSTGRLRGVGGRIVAETFHRAMQGSAESIVRDPTWRPTLGRNNRTFEMTDLLLFAFEGRRELLAPLG